MSIKIENVEVIGWEPAIRGMRNPKNSWDRSDSYKTHIEDVETLETADFEFFVGENDEKLMKSLASGGPVHAKYRRMIAVYLDITAPLYWWKEFDTYRVGVEKNSCSTMHKVAAKEFTIDDFSREHLITYLDKPEDCADLDKTVASDGVLNITIHALNFYRNKYLEAQTKPMKDESKRAEVVKKYWWQMIQLLPSSYNQKRTVMLNYEVLANMYASRKNHKLDEWRVFCDWIKSLPHSDLITGENTENVTI